MSIIKNSYVLSTTLTVTLNVRSEAANRMS
jgi:hypothetical protein